MWLLLLLLFRAESRHRDSLSHQGGGTENEWRRSYFAESRAEDSVGAVIRDPRCAVRRFCSDAGKERLLT